MAALVMDADEGREIQGWKRWIVPGVLWSVLSLAVWGTYVGAQMGSGGRMKVWWETPECGGSKLPLSDCDMLLGAWIMGWIYIVLHLVLLVVLGFLFKRLREESRLSAEGGHELGYHAVPSAPEAAEEGVGAADAPGENKCR
ncbi:hypothetical protein F5144DRAFT_586200 [Chaetomium tenue]|uniref:Uncharacterized protein n=1 Tax=Chaetomium tenue TaxID=1854479 RepID=A0ACB7NV40_9PEZI|nr:hypothetical protein F5144DRAFT_586200 [Chaetomium globosum]